MTERNDFPKLDQTRIAAREGGKAVMTFGLAARLIFRGGETRAVRETILDTLVDYAAWAGDRVTHFQRDGARSLTKLGPDGVRGAYAAECAKLDPEESNWAPVVLPKEPVANIGISAMLQNAWSAQRYPNSTLSAHFPAATARTEPDALIARLLDWCGRLKPMQGVVGLSPLFELGMERSYPQVYWPFLSRFVGFDHDWGFAMSLGDVRAIKGVNWLTILDDGFVAELGGKAALRKAVGPEAEVLDWAGGVLIRAGAEPQIGDRNIDDWPEAYIAVNRALRPIRFEAYPSTPMAFLKVPPPLDPVEETLKWVRRFDRDEG